MVQLLARVFIKDYKNSDNPAVRLRYGILCGIMGILFNLILFTGKSLAGLLSGSIAIMADAFNNLSDAASSLITLIGFRMAGQKPDPDHPFGHGRVEYIAGLLVSVLIMACGFELLKSSLSKILKPEEMQFSPVVLVILGVSILVKFYMFLYNKMIGKRIRSSAMQAVASDSLGDVLATTVVLVSTLVSFFFGINVDGIGGMIVACFICYAGYTAARDTISPLLGSAPDPEFVKRVQELVLSHEGILDMHDLIVHDYGPGRVFLTLHAEVDAAGDLITVHDLIDEIEHELREELQCRAVLHMDPVRINDEETILMKAKVKKYINDMEKEWSLSKEGMISIHDFRLVHETDGMKMLFDVVTPYRFPKTDDEVVSELTMRIKSEYPGIRIKMEVDKESRK